MKKQPLQYVLITPARNEAKFIELTLLSVVSQTVRPLKWMIVSDGSMDGTDEIVRNYAAKNEWIELIRMPERRDRHFGGKVQAFNAGLSRVLDLKFDIIGNLDGDGSFEPDYIEFLLAKFEENPKLGIAGTNYREPAWEKKLKYDYRFSSSEDVSGLCQLVRRDCFESFGGYKPSRHGGIDLIASIEARMHGWETRTFSGKFAIHHRQQGTAETHKLLVEFQNGRKDFMFGGHPLWEILRAFYRLGKKPYLIGGCFILGGYLWAAVTMTPKTVQPEIVRFRRDEQMKRLRKICGRALGLAHAKPAPAQTESPA